MYINKMGMGIEQHIPNLFARDRNIIKNNATMAFYNEKEQLYLETNALRVAPGAGFLGVREGIQFPRNKVPINSVCIQ